MSIIHVPAAPLFGPAGRGESFKTRGFKAMADVPDYLAEFGLTAFEYQSGHGVKVNADTMKTLAKKGAACGLAYSIHAPYYISMASVQEDKRHNSLRYLRQSAEALRMLGGSRIIFHCGGVGGQPRGEAMARTRDTLAAARQMLDDEGYADLFLCPETMGKYAQLGNLEEILTLCRADRRHVPCLDFGHLNSLMQGGLKTRADFSALIETVGTALDDERAKGFHVHFSKIEYTGAGEKKHLTFEDSHWGPPFEPFLEAVAHHALCPVVICESSGTQTEDAAAMMKYYKKYARKIVSN